MKLYFIAEECSTTLAYLSWWRENSTIFGALDLNSLCNCPSHMYLQALMCIASHVAIAWYMFCKHMTGTNTVGWLTVHHVFPQTVLVWGLAN